MFRSSSCWSFLYVASRLLQFLLGVYCSFYERGLSFFVNGPIWLHLERHKLPGHFHFFAYLVKLFQLLSVFISVVCIRRFVVVVSVCIRLTYTRFVDFYFTIDGCTFISTYHISKATWDHCHFLRLCTNFFYGVSDVNSQIFNFSRLFNYIFDLQRVYNWWVV